MHPPYRNKETRVKWVGTILLFDHPSTGLYCDKISFLFQRKLYFCSANNYSTSLTNFISLLLPRHYIKDISSPCLSPPDRLHRRIKPWNIMVSINIVSLTVFKRLVFLCLSHSKSTQLAKVLQFSFTHIVTDIEMESGWLANWSAVVVNWAIIESFVISSSFLGYSSKGSNLRLVS